MKRNPYQVGLLVVGGFCLVLAHMFVAVLSAMTDYEVYDVAGAEALSMWMYLLIGVGSVMGVGAVVIAGVEWSLRHGNDAQGMSAVDTTPAREWASAGSDETAR